MNKIDLKTYWHSTAHILAASVKELFPEVKLGIGPAIENGFYYDFYRRQPFLPSDLKRIEKKMAELIKRNLPFERIEKEKNEAITLLKKLDEPFKIELVKELADEKVSFYRNGNFIDLCRGPHLASTGKIKVFSLLSIAAAYWKGDENRESLQRIYGISFPTKKELENYLTLVEEAKSRDHRKLGKELDLFSIHPEAGSGLIYWHPKGALIRKIIEDFLREEHLKKGYDLLYTPHLANLNQWKISGHWDFYQELMYPPIKLENQEFMVRPMNCPGHILIYKSGLHSYRDLPIRWAELGTVYRLEKSGVLHGLLRVRGFTQDDAHIFCQPEQLEAEILSAIEFAVSILQSFGFSQYDVRLSTRPEKYVGTTESWEKATAALKKSLDKKGLTYSLDPGEGVFYGPKIDIKIKDALGRSWQCSTIQVDFNLPERFHLKYINNEGKERKPIMIHRAILGSLERFFGVLIEHYKGAFPLWLSPWQTIVLPITEKENSYANQVSKKLTDSGIRSRVDLGGEKIAKRIRKAEMEKIPYMAVVGKREAERSTIALRERGKGDCGEKNLKEFILEIKEKIAKKSQSVVK